VTSMPKNAWWGSSWDLRGETIGSILGVPKGRYSKKIAPAGKARKKKGMNGGVAERFT